MARSRIGFLGYQAIKGVQREFSYLEDPARVEAPLLPIGIDHMMATDSHSSVRELEERHRAVVRGHRIDGVGRVTEGHGRDEAHREASQLSL